MMIRSLTALVVALVSTLVAAPGASAQAASFGNTAIFLDDTPPRVTIDQASGQADPTAASPINFTVVFSEPVSGFAAGDVTLGGVAGPRTAVVTEIGPNDGTTYNVAVSGMSGDGEVVAWVDYDVATDADGLGNVASTSTDNTVTFKANAPPSATVVDGQCSSTNMASGAISLVLSDSDRDPLTLTLASNSNPTLVPTLAIAGSGNNRDLTVTAAARRSGNATLTLDVSDGTVTVPLVVTVIVGTVRDETLNGTAGTDIIFGLGGRNTINGNAGNDLLCGGNSNDSLNGGGGNDILGGENGDDTLRGGDGNDILRGNSGNDILTGGAGADAFSGGPGTDSATDFDAPQGDAQEGTIP